MSIIYLQIYFVSIACILGTGILGLPVTLYKSGFYPFLITFLLTYIFQALTICITTEVLQRACINQFLAYKEYLDEELHDVIKDKKESKESTPDESTDILKDDTTQPNLHTLGEMFLCNGVRQFFDFMVVVQLSSLLIGYCLAGSESYSQILHIEKAFVLPVYVIVLSSLILFTLHLIQPIISVLTFFKGTAFALTVIITCIVGIKIQQTVTNDYRYTTNPFLMGTVALGGTPNVMPFLYRNIAQNKTQIKKYLLAILAALTTCTILNILWCWSVLEIVPQLDICSNSDKLSQYIVYNHTLTNPDYCSSHISLQRAERNGEISTTPLVKLIHQEFSWVSKIIEVFIMISVSVSYLTLGTALNDIICGIIHSILLQQKSDSCVPHKCQTEICQKIITRLSTGFLFGVIFLISIFNLKSFVTVMEKVSSFTTNTQNIIMFCMYFQSRRMNSHAEIPLPVPKWMHFICYLLPLYFGFAIIYDGVITISGNLDFPKQHNSTYV